MFVDVISLFLYVKPERMNLKLSEIIRTQKATQQQWQKDWLQKTDSETVGRIEIWIVD